jgi:hypothetical protein
MHSEESLPPKTGTPGVETETEAPIKLPNPAEETELETPRVGSRDAPGG